MTHLGFTSLTSRFNLSVRKRVGGVEAVVLSISQSILPSDHLISGMSRQMAEASARLTLFLSHIW